jgi:hypothetical protein
VLEVRGSAGLWRGGERDTDQDSVEVATLELPVLVCIHDDALALCGRRGGQRRRGRHVDVHCEHSLDGREKRRIDPNPERARTRRPGGFFPGTQTSPATRDTTAAHLPGRRVPPSPRRPARFADTHALDLATKTRMDVLPQKERGQERGSFFSFSPASSLSLSLYTVCVFRIAALSCNASKRESIKLESIPFPSTVDLVPPHPCLGRSPAPSRTMSGGHPLDRRDSSSSLSPGLAESPRADGPNLVPNPPPVSLPYPHYTLAPVLDACDNVILPLGPFSPTAPPTFAVSTTSHKQYDQEPIVPFFVEIGDSQPVGFLRPAVVDALKVDNVKMNKFKVNECWKILENDEGRVWAVAFEDWLNEEGAAARQEHIDRLVRSWKQAGLFASELGGPWVPVP